MAYASEGRPPTVEIIGHRGSPREHRENTIASFRRAFADGADAVELDVHATRDGVIVVHHDAATNSRPGDSGTVAVIAESMLDAIQSIAVGSGGTGGTERIPTLEALLETVPRDSTVYVEVKAPRIEAEVVAVIRASGRACAVHSFDHRVARRVHDIAPEIPVGVLQTSYPVDPLRAIYDAGARDLWQQWELIDEALVRLVHGDARRIIAWTVNSPDVARRLLDWGVDGICSDVPGTMRALVGDLAGGSRLP
jgi:glycerophosphoryl diester phosphodiesterase